MPKNKNIQLFMPALFTLMWSTGFVGARLSAPYADPLTFLFYRFLIASALLLPICFLLKQSFPKNPIQIFHSSVAGIMLQAVYLGSVFYAVRRGYPIALTSLIVGLQPVLTSFLAQVFLKEPIKIKQWAGLILGFAGIAIALVDRLTILAGVENNSGIDLLNTIVVFLGLFGITFGTLYQKKYCGKTNLVSGVVIQYLSSAVFIFIFAYLLEPMSVIWNVQTIFALSWLVFALSIGAILIFFYLIRERATSSTTSLFYLIPPLVTIEGYLFFGETLNLNSFAGMFVSLCGIFLIVASPK